MKQVADRNVSKSDNVTTPYEAQSPRPGVTCIATGDATALSPRAAQRWNGW